MIAIIEVPEKVAKIILTILIPMKTKMPLSPNPLSCNVPSFAPAIAPVSPANSPNQFEKFHN